MKDQDQNQSFDYDPAKRYRITITPIADAVKPLPCVLEDEQTAAARNIEQGIVIIAGVVSPLQDIGSGDLAEDIRRGIRILRDNLTAYDPAALRADKAKLREALRNAIECLEVCAEDLQSANMSEASACVRSDIAVYRKALEA